MTTTAPTDEQQAGEFAAAVRARLADLPESELDELLDGLQADLAERLADGGELGDPTVYADELRQAAGLPPRGENETKAKKSVRESLRETKIDLAQRTRAFWAATPARRAIRDFVISLRPVWWVMRGVVVAWLLLVLVVHNVVGGWLSIPALLFTAALVMLSVQWGRGRWAPKAWLVWARRIASTVAAVLLLPFAGLVWGALASPNYVYVDAGYLPNGITHNGEQVSNIFAFDCNGQPLEGVQLFDQNGRPITTLDGDYGAGAEPAMGWDEQAQQDIRYERNGLAGYAGTWNVFPLQEARVGWGSESDASKAEGATWPMESTLPLSPDCPTGAVGEGEGDPRLEDGTGTEADPDEAANGTEAGSEMNGDAEGADGEAATEPEAGLASTESQENDS